MVDGLWAGTESLTADLATVTYRIQLLGFNAIRLPFSFIVSPSATYLSVRYLCKCASVNLWSVTGSMWSKMQPIHRIPAFLSGSTTVSA